MAIEINLDLSQIDKFERKMLQKAKTTAFPLAIKGTLNSLAFGTMRESKQTIASDFTTRNKFTIGSVRVDPVRTLKISEMVAAVGSIASYMLAQEEGEKRTSKGKSGLRIPTGAAGDQTTLFPRKRVIKKKYRRGQIKLANEAGRIKAKSKKQFILMSIRVAALQGQSPYVFLPLGGKKTGLYKVIPKGPKPSTKYKRGKKKYARKFKWGRPRGKPGMEKLIFIHSHARKTVIIPETNWLTKNVETVSGTMAVTFIKEADRVFDRIRL